MRTAPHAAAAAALLLAHAATAIGPEVIVSSIPNSPSSLVPGSTTDERFSRDFDNLYRSPNGSRWIVTNRPASSTEAGNRYVLTGAGPSFTVPVNLEAGEITPWSTPGDEDFLNDGAFGVAYAINDAGAFAMGVSQAVSRIVRFDGAGWSTVVRAGDPIPFGAPGRAWGTSFDVYGLSPDAARVHFRGSTADLAVDLFIVHGAVAVETGLTVPTGQLTPGLPWENFGNSGYISLDGAAANWLAVGDVTGTTSDDVAALNNAAVAQQGVPFANQAAVANSRLSIPYLTGNGAHWHLRGTSGTTHWIARDGAVIAATGLPIAEGSTELWAGTTGLSRTFASAVGDNAGNYVIIGGTSAGATSGAAVYNGERVLVRQGDPLDADGNGVYDDDVYILGLAAVDFYTNFLGEDGHWYATVAVRDGAGTGLGEAIIRVPVNPCPANFDASPDGVQVADIFAFLSAWFAGDPASDFNANTTLGEVADIFAFLSAWFAGC